MFLLALLSTGLTSTVQADTDIGPYRFEAFECAEGLSLQSVILKEPDVQVDKCVDARGLRQGVLRYTRLADESVEGEAMYVDDRKQGVLRVYDKYGFLASEAMYEAGVEISSRYTVRGLQEIAKVANDDLLARGSTLHLSVDDEQTLRYQTVVSGKAPGRLGRDQRRVVLGFICKLMRYVPQLKRIEILSLSPSGATVRQMRLSVAECQGPFPKTPGESG